ncbi:MAG: transposase [Bacteroidetes bacterium]|nr:transposase [Bacteroidota bacterium]
MPDHVHVLMRTYAGVALATIVRLWKGYTGRRIERLPEEERRLSHRAPWPFKGVWMRDYWDRFAGMLIPSGLVAVNTEVGTLSSEERIGRFPTTTMSCLNGKDCNSIIRWAESLDRCTYEKCYRLVSRVRFNLQ